MPGSTHFNSAGSAMPSASPGGKSKPEEAVQDGGRQAGSTVENDARGQFVRSKAGHDNNGVVSATPRVTTGTDDATFENGKEDEGEGKSGG